MVPMVTLTLPLARSAAAVHTQGHHGHHVAELRLLGDP